MGLEKMASEIQIERLRKEDFDDLMDMLLRSFRAVNPSHKEFDILYPDLYQRTDEKMSNHYVIRDKGNIVSCIGLYPVKLNLCGKIVELGGIGAVATVPEYRGKGLMQRLMDYVMQVQIEERGYAFSLLGGDRKRYQHWGFEIGNTKYSFRLTLRGPGVEKYSGKLSQEDIKEGNVDEFDWSEIWRQVQSNPDMCACSEEDLKLKYKRLDRIVVIVEGDKGGHLVIVKGNNKDVVIQSYAGEPETLGAVIVSKLESGEWNTVDARLPMYPNKFCGIFKDLMVDYDFGYTGKICVLNLQKTFDVFKEHFNSRVNSLGLKGKILLKVSGIGVIPSEQVILEADGKELKVSQTANEDIGKDVNIVELTRHQIVELMFSPLCLGWSYRLADNSRWLAALMPVPYYIPPLYHI